MSNGISTEWERISFRSGTNEISNALFSITYGRGQCKRRAEERRGTEM
jgi:hypothetical protein